MLKQVLMTSSTSLARSRRAKALRRPITVLLVTILWLAPILLAGTWVSAQTAKFNTVASSGVITSGPAPWAQWVHVTTTTTPHFAFPTASNTSDLAVDPAFARYYATHAGATLLGPALTPGLPTRLGIVQFFSAGALLQPNEQTRTLIRQQSQLQSEPTTPSAIPPVFGQATGQLLRDGLYDRDSEVVQLTLFHALLSFGSTLPIAGDGSSMRYTALRSALQPAQLLANPEESNSALHTSSPMSSASDMFIAEGKRGTTSVGHVIPHIFWDYITRDDISPDGWPVDFGQPLTEALPLTTSRNGGTHHLLVQAFSNAVLVADSDAPDASGQPSVWLLDIGSAYLQTFGPPTLDIHSGEEAWGMSESAVLDAPANGTATLHSGQAFPFTLLGDSQWLNGALWYDVRWQTPSTSGNGWISAAALSFTSPGDTPAWASFEALSPDLARYLAAQGKNTGAVVYDVTRNQYYTYNPNDQFIMASSAKVPIMLTFLTMTERQGREPNDNEMYLLTTMIENSDNVSAQDLFDEIGGTPPMDAFMRSVGVPGLTTNPNAWGWSTVSPLAMVRLLTLLHEGKVLTAHDRDLMLNLMRNVESDQQVGVGDTAPSGATVALKDGWVPAPDDLWAMNSSGIVTVGGETYIIAAYTQHEGSLDDGWNITRHVCAAVAQSLA